MFDANARGLPLRCEFFVYCHSVKENSKLSEAGVSVGTESTITTVTAGYVRVGEGLSNYFYGANKGKLLKLASSPEVSNKEEDTVPAINLISEEVTTLLDSVCLCIQYTKGEYKVYGEYLEEGVVIKSVGDIKKLVEAITTITEFTKGV